MLQSIPGSDVSFLVSSLVVGGPLGQPSSCLDALCLALIGMYVLRECAQTTPVVSKIWSDVAGSAVMSTLITQAAQWADSASESVLAALHSATTFECPSIVSELSLFKHSHLCECLLRLFPWVSTAIDVADLRSTHVLISNTPYEYIAQGNPILEDPVPVEMEVEPSACPPPALPPVPPLIDVSSNADHLWCPALTSPSSVQNEVLLAVCGAWASVFTVANTGITPDWEDSDTRMRKLCGESVLAVLEDAAKVEHDSTANHMRRMVVLVCRRVCELDFEMCVEFGRADVWYVHACRVCEPSPSSVFIVMPAGHGC